MSDSMQRAALAKAFVEEMRRRGVERLDDEAVRYHLALLLKPEGHPTIKVSDSVCTPPQDSNGAGGQPSDGIAADPGVRALGEEPQPPAPAEPRTSDAPKYTIGDPQAPGKPCWNCDGKGGFRDIVSPTGWAPCQVCKQRTNEAPNLGANVPDPEAEEWMNAPMGRSPQKATESVTSSESRTDNPRPITRCAECGAGMFEVWRCNNVACGDEMVGPRPKTAVPRRFAYEGPRFTVERPRTGRVRIITYQSHPASGKDEVVEVDEKALLAELARLTGSND